jgi:hypothetical protein|nr:MAG TPA: hypothetical protein [Caudoviricetes sp.]
MSKYDLYLNAYIRTVKNFDPYKDNSTDAIKKAVFYGVKAINNKPKREHLIEEEIVNEFNFISGVKALMSVLTPKEFTNMFPIEKDYDGDKYQMKDYFYTRDYISKLDSNRPIGNDERILEFLWEYHNWDISFFVIASTRCISDYNRLHGEPTFMDDFAETMGLDTYTVYRDDKGNDFIIDDGRTVKLEKPKPRRPKHFKVIK